MLRLHEQRRRLHQPRPPLHPLLGIQTLNPPLRPSLPPLHLHRPRPQHQILPRLRRLPVINTQIRRDPDLIRHRLKRTPRQALVHQRRQQPAMHQPRVSGHVRPDVHDADHALAVLLVPLVRRDNDHARPREGPARQAVRAHGLGDLKVRAGLNEVGFCAELLGERAGLDVGVDLAGEGVGGFVDAEGFFVGDGFGAEDPGEEDGGRVAEGEVAADEEGDGGDEEEVDAPAEAGCGLVLYDHCCGGGGEASRSADGSHRCE